MGRRALPKRDRGLDHSKHFLVLEDMQPPFQPNEVFEIDRPLEIEIGTGKGLFIRNACSQFPDRNFLGIEIAHRYSRYAAAKLAEAGLDNGRVMQGDGVRFLDEFVNPHSVHAVHVYFPDPWWKARHRKRRVLNEKLLAAVERVLIPGGELHFWTDVLEYYESTLELIKSTKLIGPLEVIERPAEHELDYRTHFERRTRLNEAPVYRSLFRTVGGNG